MDVSHFTAKERKESRKQLLKKIDIYNKHAKEARKAKRPSFPITSPSKDLLFKGILKVTYDRGYALQTKSILVESNTTAAEVVEQLSEALGLRGTPSDYALEERNVMTGEIHLLGSKDTPLHLQLNYGPHRSYMELRLVQIRDTRAAPMLATVSKASFRRHKRNGGSGSDESVSGGSSPNVIPKDEVIDHGIASVELVMEEALQDIPPLVHDIQERLKCISESVAIDGKPRPGLPNRRLLWDLLKPLASALVKDVRRLVDSGEFLANRHCSSSVCKLVVTLLLELITDHSRELVTVTKEMCGLRGAAKTDFSASVSNFTQQVTYISKLVGKCNESLHAMALSSHLLEVTSPDNFLHGRLTSESYFTGSGSVSGVLIFTVVSAYLGLVRAAYEEKKEYYASLATNMLRSTHRALETVQKTDEYAKLHLHPLRSRVRDMEHKLKVAMDNLVRGVKVAASSRPPPDATPQLLLYGHALIMATLDFLMVAQCASLLHTLSLAGWEVMQFPWVKTFTDASPEGKSDTTGAPSSFADQLSSVSNSTGSTGDSSQKGEKVGGERRSRIPTHQRESGDGMDAAELAASEQKGQVNFGQLGLRASRLKLPYYRESQEDEEGGDSGEEEGDGGRLSVKTHSPPVTPLNSDTEDGTESALTTDIESQRSGAVGGRMMAVSKFDMESSKYMGIDAVKKLRLHFNINKAIARGAESLLLTVTQKINVLSALCREGAREKYVPTVELIIGAARQIREEVSTMELDLLVGQLSMCESVEWSESQMEGAAREVHLAALMASSPVAPDSAGMKLMAAVEHLKDICSNTVGDALTTVGEHKKALNQAEKIEQEFITLMTGQKQGKEKLEEHEERHLKRKFSSPAKLAMAGESSSTGIIFENTSMPEFGRGGRGWATKEAPRVMGGTTEQLVQRLTHHKVIDSEFVESFLLTFSSFMSPVELMDALIARYNIRAPGGLSSWEEETFETDIIIPIRLRVIHAMRTWLSHSFDDFKDERLRKKLQEFLKIVQNSMSSCSKQLQKLLEENLSKGPVHTRTKPRGHAPAPLVPMGLSHGENFDLLDVNTLELARQLTLAYSGILREFRPEELLSLGWRDDSHHHLVPNIVRFLQLSRNLSELVCREIERELVEEDQASVISYFIQSAKSCLELKNYEAVFALMKGLESRTVQQAEGSWQMVTDHLLGAYKELKEMVSPNIGYHRYRQDIRVVHQSPCIPHLVLILSNLEAIDKDHLDFLPDMERVVNFQKRRQYAKVVQQLHKYQSVPYNLHPIEVIQKYLHYLKRQLAEEELEHLSTKVEVLKL